MMFNTDILFYISDFLDDKSSFNLFLTNKYYSNLIKKYPYRYNIKKVVKDISKHKIKKLVQNPEMITELGERLYNTVKDKYDLNKVTVTRA